MRTETKEDGRKGKEEGNEQDANDGKPPRHFPEAVSEPSVQETTKTKMIRTNDEDRNDEDKWRG